MISLKAISTLLKKFKTKLFILFIFLLLSPSFLGAESFRLSLSGPSSQYKLLVEDVLSSFSFFSSSLSLEIRKEREEREIEIEYLKKLTENSQKERMAEIKKRESGAYSSLSLELVDVDLSPYYTFLASSDKEAFSYLRIKNSLDGIIYVSVVNEGEIEKVEIIYNSKLIHSAHYNSLLKESEEEALYSLFSSLFLGDSYDYYRLDIYPTNTTVTIDGNICSSSYVILEKGEHNISLDCLGYIGESFSFNTEEGGNTIEYTLKEKEPFSLYVSTLPYSSAFLLNGKREETKLIQKATVPISLSFSSDGFLDYSFQTKEEESVINVSLEPQWIDNEALLKDKKNDFYSSLFYLLLSFGGYTASIALENIYSSSIAVPLRVVFTGTSLVSLVRMIDCATSYYQASGIGL